MYIDLTYFNGDLNIPGNPVTNDQLQWFINKYEPEFLRKVLGQESYQAFTYGGNPPTNPAWLALLNGQDYVDLAARSYRWRGLVDTTIADQPQSPIANYVYYWFMRNNASKTTSMGEKTGKAENAGDAGPAEKMVRAWNEMAEWVWQMQHFLRTKGAAVYPLWNASAWYGNLSPWYNGGYLSGYGGFTKINTFGI